MSTPNYTLEIVSHHPKFDNKSLRKYYVEGIETVGVWGDEPFEIRFKNNTWQKVQVKLTLDGTDILTGKPADTEVSKNMWVVNGYDTLKLKAWPETNNGGAQFVFTSANNSVAVHTHGDLSSRGIIAAAVFTEGHVEPLKFNPPTIIDHHHYHYDIYRPYWTHPIWVYYNSYNSGDTLGGMTFNSGSIGSNISSIYSSNGVNSSLECSTVNNSSSQLEELVAVGAGQYVDQNISYVAGLIKPLFSETVRVRYLWWDDLVTKLKEANVPAPHAS